jgi:UDP-N-acetylglucosamine--N-acetylmuramyl-(pentapeptide) pyrophosphoryl-undecaprenol N-acetylglucosamine transferase
VWAAKRLGVPVVIHESDITPGLANKLCVPFADKICYAFPDTKKALPENKSIYTGLPVREELFSGVKEKGLKLMGFNGEKPVILLMGGSQGSVFLNNCLRASLESLLKNFDICHLCGKNNIDPSLVNLKGYCQFEYVNEELKDLLSACDIVISRGGATALFELVALKKPTLVIPLSKRASRGDQILNAKAFKAEGLCEYIEEEDIIQGQFDLLVNSLYEKRAVIAENQERKDNRKSISSIINILLSVMKK